MFPSAALANPVFRTYVGIMIGVLVGAGAILAVLQFVFRIELGNVWKTYYSWLWMAPLVAVAVFAGRGPFIVGVTALAVLSFKEFALAAGLYCDRWMIVTVSAGIVAVGVAAWIGNWLIFAALAPMALILVLPILQNRPRGAVQRMALGMIAFLYLGWMFGHLGFLANTANAYGYLCYLILATEVNDVAGFICGKMFGRRRLRSEISPRKTWEGAIGALAISMTLPWLLRFSFPFFGPWQLLLTGLIVGIGGPLGDLSLSVIKRDFGSKDWGAAIPGHGGILDRIDSLIFVAPLFMQMAGYYYPGG